MTNLDEIKHIINDTEVRVLKIVHAEIDKLRNEVKEDREKSHNALAATISNFGSEVIRASNKLEAFLEKKGADIDTLTIWKAVHESETKEFNKQIGNIQANMQKVMWIVLAGVIVAVLGLVLK